MKISSNNGLRTAQKGKRPKRGMKGVVLLSDMGELPAYNVDDFYDMIRKAQQQTDRLCQFSGDQLEDCIASDEEVLDWKAERAKAVKVLNRYSRDAFKIIVTFSGLIHSVRDSIRLIEICDSECDGREVARTGSRKR